MVESLDAALGAGGRLKIKLFSILDIDVTPSHGNAACDAKFVPFVKMVKGINREANDAIQPSFLLEVMGLDLVLEPFGRYRDEIRFFLASAAERITDDWPDPAGLGPKVNGGMSRDKRLQLAGVLKSWLAVAEEALLLENEGKERKLFGWRMPLP
jgi:hypothetical protein